MISPPNNIRITAGELIYLLKTRIGDVYGKKMMLESVRL